MEAPSSSSGRLETGVRSAGQRRIRWRGHSGTRLFCSFHGSEQLDPDPIRVLDVHLGSLRLCRRNGRPCALPEELPVRLADVADDEREMVHLIAFAVPRVESAPFGVPVQLEPVRGPWSLEVDVAPAMRHCPPADDLQAEDLRVELQGAIEVSHANPCVVEPELHAETHVSEKERVRPAEWRPVPSA